MKVYIKINEEKQIIVCDTTCFEGYIEIDIEESLFETCDILDYCYIDGKLVLDEEAHAETLKNREMAIRQLESEEALKEIEFARTLFSLTDVEAYSCRYLYPEWDSNGCNYKINERFMWNDKFYKVILDHKSQEDWKPDTASSLYVEISDPTEEWPEFKQPTGAHNAYQEGDKVTFEGKHYISTMNNNAYSPKDYPQGWKEVK